LAARPSTSSGRTGEEHKDAVVLASPAVRARARDRGVELSQIRVGEGERVRHADLDAFLRYGSGQGYQAPHSTRARPDEAVRVIGMRR
ncbi:E3 binding domain-containing protein, partial [Enterococcus faecium]|uniref:E3 binding domain-containing protein n=1 Tax=Enterococcus faecium TaxID=1352 RepID=UPI003F43F214